MAVAAVEGTGAVDVQYGLVHSTGELRKDTSLPYILHLAFDSGSQPFAHSRISPCATTHPFLSKHLSHPSQSVTQWWIELSLTDCNAH